MKRYLTASTLALLALLTACAALGLWYLQSDRFQMFARDALVSRIEKATGLECRIDDVRFHVLRGRFALTGLSLSPRIAAPGLVALKVDAVRASFSISSLWHFRVRLAELDIAHPQVRLTSGGDSSGWSPEGILKNLKMSLRLEAAKVLVSSGVIQINDRPAPFHFSLKNLDCEVRYAQRIPSYRIRVEYEQGRIFWERRNIVHDLAVSADLSLQGIDIEFFKFRHGSSLLTGSGALRNWASPVLLIHAGGLYDAKDLVLAHASINKGRGAMGVTADLRFDAAGVAVKGSVSVRSGGYRKMDFNDLAGRFEIRRDVLYLRGFSGKVSGGNLQVDAVIQLREANNALNRVAIASRGVPVADVGRLLDLPLLTFRNAADTATTITWHGGEDDLKVDCDAVVHGLAQTASGSASSTPLDGSIRFVYLGTGDIYIAGANLRSPGTSIQAVGREGDSFRVQMSTTRIAEPFTLIAGFSPAIADLIARQPDVLEMAGDFYFSGDVRIKSSSDVTYHGDVAVKNGSWRTYRVEDLSAHADFIPPRVVFRDASIRSGSQTADGTLDLVLGNQEQVSNFGFNGNLHRVSIASLKDFGADTSNVEGILSGSGHAKFENGEWQGEGDFLIERGRYRAEAFDRLRAKVQLRDQQLRLYGAEAQRGTARMSAEGLVDLKRRQLNVSARLAGLSLGELPQVRKKRLPLQGVVSGSGALAGTFDDPSFSGDIDLSGLQYRSYNLGNGKGSIRLEAGTVRGGFRIRSNYGAIAIQGRVATAGGHPGAVNLEFENLDIQKIVAGRVPPFLKEISTALAGKVEIDGKFDDPSALRMQGEVDGAHFKVQDYELHNAGRIQFGVYNRKFRIDSARFVGEGTSLILSGTIPLDDAPQLDLSLNGNLNLQLLQGVDKRALVGGSANLDIRASGSKRDPQIIGRASFQNARLDHADLPFQITALQGDMVFSRNLVRFENVRGTAASGTLQLSGMLEHQNAVLRSINLNILLRKARLPYPKDFHSVVDADLVLNGTGDVQILTGDVNVIRAEYVRSFNLLEQLAGGGMIQASPLTTGPALMGLRLNIEIHSDNGLIIDNELTRLRGSGRLTLRGSPAYPSLTGRVEASEGMIFFRGNHFEITHASADFVDRNRINPVLEIRAEADVKTYRLILDAIGDLEHLNLNITSDPQMSTVEILSLLTTGKTDTGITTTQRKSEMVGVSAASVLSENLTGVIGKRVQRILGLESFRVDPFLAGAENDPTARITISERLSKDLVVTFSRNLTTNQEQIVVIEYDVTRNLSLVATRDEDGKYGLDFRFRKRFQ